MTPGDMFLYMNIRKTPDLLATVKVGLIKKKHIKLCHMELCSVFHSGYDSFTIPNTHWEE